MMDRRRFLGTLLASVGVLAIDPSKFLWQPDATAVAVIDPGAILTLERITREMLVRIVNTLQVRVPSHAPRGGSKISHTIYPHPALVLNQQYNIGMCVPDSIDRFGLDPERYIIPAADALSRRVQGVKGCGTLPHTDSATGIASCIATDPVSGLSLRGLFAPEYLGAFRGDQLRFDMLVAQ